jgi:hypothetical protein
MEIFLFSCLNFVINPCFLNFFMIIFDVDFFSPSLLADDFTVIFSSVTNLISYFRVLFKEIVLEMIFFDFFFLILRLAFFFEFVIIICKIALFFKFIFKKDLTRSNQSQDQLLIELKLSDPFDINSIRRKKSLITQTPKTLTLCYRS